MSNILSKGLSSLKYVYLIVFFALLSGFFHPLILSVCLAGCILLYKTTTSENKKGIFFVSGFSLIIISLYFIFQMTGRV
jgi:hypothetical protein